MQFGVMTTVWKRPALTKLMLTHVRAAAEEAFGKFIGVASYSEDGADQYIEAHGWQAVRSPNAPLGQKHINTIKALRGRVDVVVVISTDNFVAPEFLRGIRKAFEHDPNLGGVGPLDIYQIDLVRNRGAKFLGYPPPRSGMTLGAGRALHASLLDKMQWAPWVATFNKGLDHSMQHRLSAVGGTILGRTMAQLGGALLDVKTGTNISKFVADMPMLRRVCKLLPVDAVLADFPPRVQQDLANFRL